MNGTTASGDNLVIALALIMSLVTPFSFAQTQSEFRGDYFEPGLLEKPVSGQSVADLSVYAQGRNQQMPGIWRIDIAVNNNLVTTQPREVLFIQDPSGEGLLACISVDELNNWGVRTQDWPELKGDGKCSNLSVIPGAFQEFRANQLVLNLSVPQVAMVPHYQDIVPSTEWDEGIPALLMNYTLNGSRSESKDPEGASRDDLWLNLRPGVNVGPWRFRNYSTWQQGTDSARTNTVYSYVQRDVVSIRGQLTLGDSNTPADIFDSIPFRGMQIASDDDMLPVSQRSYAPVIRGIARSEALVTVRQNGYVVYQTNVAPGAFAITDISPSGGAGDLNVTIREADGREQNTVVPYATLPVLVRQGYFRYSLSGGEYRSWNSGTGKSPFIQGTGTYGLPLDITLYGGMQNAGHRYQSWSVGAGKNLGEWGAVSGGLTYSSALSRDGIRRDGQSVRVLYNKNILATGSNITIAGWRYSSDGFRTLNETLESHEYTTERYQSAQRRKNRAEVMINQSLGQVGAFHLSLINEDYRGGGIAQSVNLGYNRYIQGVSLGAAWTYNRNCCYGYDSPREQLFSLNVNVPLDVFMAHTWASYNATYMRGHGTQHNLGLNGTLLEDNNLSWGGYVGQQYQGKRSIAGNINWKSSKGTFSGGVSHDDINRIYTYGASGGLLLHENGLTLSGPLGETIGLIKAPGAGNVRISNFQGDATDSRGYAVVSWLSPYRKNELILDGGSLPEETEVTQMSRQVVPTRGAVVRAEYQVRTGHRMLMTLIRPDGSLVPFGALVTQGSEPGVLHSAIVGERGQVFLSGLQENGVLYVRWSGEKLGQCKADYTVGDKNPVSGLYQGRAICR